MFLSQCLKKLSADTRLLTITQFVVLHASRETAGSWLFVHLPEHQHAQHKTLQALHLALPGLQQSSSIFRSEVRCCLKVEEQAKMLS